MLKGKTILVVDDDDRNILALSAVLRSKDPVIIIAKDGIECLKQLRDHPETDIVLLDMMMPNMDGYQTLKEIRKDKTMKTLPVISLTAQAMKGDREKCIGAGADEYCSKPVDVAVLFNQIKTLLHL